ncbi:MAG TPA: efflux RND transporter permease subunit, partial [Brevundimonas sp.]|uniref:efflux RND transporter permease subunit n=1 Tax=Brevundimonas sp. TaxID=1871086 RepID=UPI002ED9CED2
MNISRFFIDRPIFAAVIAVFVTLMGVFAYPLLPLSQYPEIAPPTITINTAYPGASAETVAETVAAPIEQEVNGVEGMLYVSSSSTSDGAVSVTVTFNPGTDLDAAQVLVQNRVALAEPRLPEQVRQIGVTVNKQESGFLMILGLTSPDKSLDNDYVGNYAQSVLRDRLLRVDGVGAVQVFGGGNYSMRVWIDPAKAAGRGLTGPDIVAALRAQNVQAAAGAIGQPPFNTNAAAFQLPVQVQGRLSNPDQFADIVIRTDAQGRVTRVRDVARVELGAQDYGIRGFFDGERGVGVAIIQQPGANALGTAERVQDEIEALKADLPQGMDVSVAYNPTEFVAASVESVQHTLIEAVILVVLVVIVFLQTWRAAIIPIVAIPVALVATFAVQLMLGFSINSLSLFALVLAVGIVVDDAIVVVENVERYIRQGLTPKEAAYRSMQEVSGALISIGLVLVSVFVPTMFV